MRLRRDKVFQPAALIAPQAHFDPVWGLAKWCVRCPLVTLAWQCVSSDFVRETAAYDFAKN